MQFGKRYAVADRLSDLFDENFDRIVVADTVARNDVPQQYLLIHAGDVVPLGLVRQRFRQAAIVQVRHAAAADSPACFGLQQVGGTVGDFLRIQILAKAVGRNRPGQVPPAQRGGDLPAHHAGVAAGDVNTLLGVRHPASKFFPAGDVLYFIKEEETFLPAQLTLHRNKVVEICCRKFGQALILKIDVDDLVPFSPLCHKLSRNIEQQGRFSRTAQAHQHIVGVFLKRIAARRDPGRLDGCVLIEDDAFQ